MKRAFIIAEAGVNHNGKLECAKRMVRAARACGADAVKFQTFTADTLVKKDTPKVSYQILATGAEESQWQMIRKLELRRENHAPLVAACVEEDIEFMSTAFDLESLSFLLSLGISRVKIPSGEVTNLPYLRKAGASGKPIILSTGMATFEEIGEALAILEKAGTRREDITVLHCVTEYPALPEEVNLLAMGAIGDRFGVKVGLSDHTMGTEVAIAAVALGAGVIEKHFTLSRSMEGPDHGASLEPDEFAGMVRAIRNLEKALGTADKKPSPAELKNRDFVRRSLVAARPIQKGEIFTPENIIAKRPAFGISPMQWDEVMGKRALHDFEEDEFIRL